ncbi:MAG: phosphate ABC transporter substrate-binding protein PstS [Acidimicrobiales bacterium]
MQPASNAAQKDTSPSALRPRTAGLARVGAAALAGALALTGVTAATAVAAPARASAVGTAARGGLTYPAVEKQLSAIETPPSSKVSLLETGSTLLYPLISVWAAAYGKIHPNIPVTTAGTGSGTGQSDALSGTVQIGASDAYLPPTDPKTLLNIPLDISAQDIAYNIKGVPQSTHLKLTGAVLDEIYSGKIDNWSSSVIKGLNPGVHLPNETIVPLHRSDGSGDTFLFSTYLDDQSPKGGWVAAQGGPGTQVQWPSISSALAEQGNQGMETACTSTPGCVAYIGVSFLNESIKDHLGEAQIRNGDGQFELPTHEAIATEVAAYTTIPTNAAESLIDSTSPSAKNGYPIVNFEYAIVNEKQPNAATAQAVKAFLAWGMDPRFGSTGKHLGPVYFQALSPAAIQVSLNLLDKVK